VNELCQQRFFNIFCMEYYILFSIGCLIQILKWRYGVRVTKYERHGMALIINVWFIARLCNSFNLSCQVDAFTVYFFIWQLVYISSKWNSDELPSFSFYLLQGFLCLSMSLFALTTHDLIFRYFPINLKVVFVWIFGLDDW